MHPCCCTNQDCSSPIRSSCISVRVHEVGRVEQPCRCTSSSKWYGMEDDLGSIHHYTITNACTKYFHTTTVLDTSGQQDKKKKKKMKNNTFVVLPLTAETHGRHAAPSTARRMKRPHLIVAICQDGDIGGGRIDTTADIYSLSCEKRG